MRLSGGTRADRARAAASVTACVASPVQVRRYTEMAETALTAEIRARLHAMIDEQLDRLRDLLRG
jgi:hypothetical protein